MTEKHAVLKEHGKNYDCSVKVYMCFFLTLTVFYRLNVVVLFIHHLELFKYPVRYKSQCVHDVCLFSFKICFATLTIFKLGLMWFSHDSDYGPTSRATRRRLRAEHCCNDYSESVNCEIFYFKIYYFVLVQIITTL